jgi:starch synthase
MGKDKLRVLIVSSESVPFAKVGGLADVVGALAKELRESGVDARIMIPKYSEVYEFMTHSGLASSRTRDFTINLEMGEVQGKVEEVEYNGTPFYFIDNPKYFRREGIYVDERTKYDFPDSLERFTFFSKAVLESAKLIDFKPDVIHSHDWQTGLIPVYLKTVYKLDSFYKNTRSVFTIHNLSYQGIFPVEQFSVTGLDWKYFTINGLEYYGHLNLMKGGIVFSDMAATVSETYAREIQTPEYGNGLEGVIRDKAMYKKLVGIVNGVDYEEWNPKVDVSIQKKFGLNFDAGSLANKQKIKEVFLADNGISNPDPRKPLIGIVSRLVDQKGFDLIFEVLDEMLKMNVYFAILGTGKHEYENRLKAARDRYPDRMIVNIGFDIPFSHYIEAASDIFLMPSRFEPCGQNQLYSLKYGTIPVVRNTGGLADTVKDDKTGFLFNDYNPDDLFVVVKKAVEMFRNSPDRFRKLIENAMREDWSWKKAAKKYMESYRQLLGESPIQE